jgi:tocopherol cyclase
MAFYNIKRIYRPEIFQGHNKKEGYFEGWYFKLVDRNLENIYAVIPGISISKDPHAFIQIMDGKNATSQNFRFDFSDFSYSTEEFKIKIGDNLFSPRNLLLDIKQDSSVIKAELVFENLSFWPKSILAPGAMGWYAFVPYMECYHGVVSMDHDIKGFADFTGKTADFTGGKGYIEKDWGLSFPQGWIWLQSNHFEIKKTSIMLSIAKIPWRSRHFTGFICGFMLDKEFYILATYNNSKIITLEYSDNKVSAVIENKNYRISIEATRKTTGKLLSPTLGAMEGRIEESIDAELTVTLQKKKRGIHSRKADLLFSGTGLAGGLEIMNPEVLD